MLQVSLFTNNLNSNNGTSKYLFSILYIAKKIQNNYYALVVLFICECVKNYIHHSKNITKKTK